MLYYLEGNDIRTCATLLGMAESTFKTRLHRARGSMKKHLETSIEAELQQLGTNVDVRPAVMSGIAAVPNLMASVGGGWSVLISLFPSVLQMGGPIAAMAVYQHFFLKNYRDDAQVRRRLMNRNIAIVAILMLVMATMQSLTFRYLGLRPVFAALAVITFSLCLHRFRQWKAGGNLFIASMVVSSFAIAVCCAAAALFGFSSSALGTYTMTIIVALGIPLAGILPVFAMRHEPVRSDYNLFQRAAMGTISDVETAAQPAPVTPDTLTTFVTFLGRHQLLIDRRQRGNAWELVLPPMQVSLQMLLPIPLIYQRVSRLLIDSQGRCRAIASPADTRTLRRLFEGVNTGALSCRIERAVGASLADFSAGNLESALQHLQSESDTQLFKRPPRELAINKHLPLISGIVMAITLALLAHFFYVLSKLR